MYFYSDSAITGCFCICTDTYSICVSDAKPEDNWQGSITLAKEAEGVVYIKLFDVMESCSKDLILAKFNRFL